MMAFLSSLSILGWIIIAVVILGLLNLRKLVFLRSPLDSQQHKNWRTTGDRPDHLDDKRPDV